MIKIEPRKKSVSDYLFPILGVIIVIYLSLLMAMSYEAVKDIPFVDRAGNVVEDKFNISAYFNDLMNRLSGDLSVKWVGMSSVKFLSVGLLICLLIAGYVMTSKKKFIFNKEYGTSEWGTPKQIAHLLAKNILNVEIKNIKKDKKISKIEKNKKTNEAKEKYSESSNEIFTQTEKVCIYNYELNRNTLIVGGSGSGKTRGYVLPNILQATDSKYSQSLVVTDPKGEILAKVGKYLESINYVIKVLNLKEQNRSFCYNPFCYIMEDKYEEQISRLVSSIMDSQMNNNQKSNDPFWEDMAKVLLKAIFYATYEGFPKKERNMGTIMELFRWFEVSDNDDRENNPTKLDKFFDVFGDKGGNLTLAKEIRSFFELCFNSSKELQNRIKNLELPFNISEMRKKIEIPLNTDRTYGIEQYVSEINGISVDINNGDDNDLKDKILPKARELLDLIDIYINDRTNGYPNGNKPIGVSLYEKYGDVNSNPALRNWEDFRTKCKGKTAQSVTATALSKLAPFDEEQIRRIFSKDEMELDLVGERKTALFIVLPPTNKTYNFIANVMYTQLFEQLEYCATVKHNQSLPVPVKFILDEFYNTGRLPNFENILSYARSFGIGITPILQSLEQLKEMYEKSWGIILDNCSYFLYLGGVKNKETLQYISDLLGKGTFDKKTYSRTKGRQSSSSTSFDKIGRELLDSSEVQRLSKKKCLLFITGYQPYMSNKFNYTSHRNYKYTSDYDKKNLYYYLMPSEKVEKDKGNADNIMDSNVANSDTKPIINEDKYKVEPIVINTDNEANIKYVQDNLLKLDIVDDEDMENIDDEELEKIIAEEEARENQIKQNINNYAVEPIVINTDNEANIKYVSENIDRFEVADSYDFDNVDDEELEKIIAEEEVKNREVTLKYPIEPITINTDIETVTEVIEKLNKKKSAEFVTEYETNENIEISEEDIEWEDDTDTVDDIDILQAVAGDIIEDMQDFMKQLNDVSFEDNDEE